MADFNALETLINAYIKQNGIQAITGNILNGVLRGMVDALGKGYTIVGVATPSTDPGTMTGPCAYYASTYGTYTHFDNIVVNDGEIAMLIYDEQVWHKEKMWRLDAEASVDANVGTPSVETSFEDELLTFRFHNIKGNPGDAAGFGNVNATVDSNIGTPGVSVQTSGPDTAKNMTFQFTNLKGETGVTSVVVTVDNTSGNPACAVSLNGQELHLDFTGLKGAQGNPGSSVDYPFTLVNNLTTNDPDQALTAAMGYQLESEISQLDLKVDDIFRETDNDDYIDAVVDKDNRIIEATKKDGTKFIQKFESPGHPSFPEAVVTEFIDAVVDSEDRVLYGAKKDGTFYARKFSSPTVDNSLKPMAGKKWVVLGDSFTNSDIPSVGTIPSGKYAGLQASYPYLIGNRTELDIVKFFEGGRTLAYPATPGTFINSVTCPGQSYYYQNIPADADYITIYLGINDNHHAPGSGGGDGEDNTGEIPLGTPTDNTTATYYGAWNVVLGWLRENRPFAHIGIIVTNGANVNYMDATLAMAKKYGYPILNLNGDERTPAMIRSANPDIPADVRETITRLQAVDYDGSQTGTVDKHPNADAHLFESFFIEEFLKTI